jgi:protoporphyrinogen oxidase
MASADDVDFLVVGAGVSGLGFANAIRERHAGARVLVVEQEREAGGYCRTVTRDGFTWDYSGHFFHFRHPEIEAWLRERMPADSVRTVARVSRVQVVADGVAHEVGFPFQTHTHELPRDVFARCLGDLRAAHAARESGGARARSFKQMLRERFGDAMCELFLVPYNEKLYATDLDALDVDAMGRFFPHASLDDVLRALPTTGAHSGGQREGYNATFTYPRGGAIEYVRALLRDLPDGCVALAERLERVDVDARIAVTSRRNVRYRHLVTSAPLPATMKACGLRVDDGVFTANQVLVFNLGFDTKGRTDAHWIYFADPSLAFYRVGFYDNIFNDARRSLYVEIGQRAGTAVDADAMRARVLADLARAGVVTTQKLVAHHHVVMNPAYVHITERSLAAAARARAELGAHAVHAIGRYGAWTYCSIEDNLVEARALASSLA